MMKLFLPVRINNGYKIQMAYVCNFIFAALVINNYHGYMGLDLFRIKKFKCR